MASPKLASAVKRDGGLSQASVLFVCGAFIFSFFAAPDVAAQTFWPRFSSGFSISTASVAVSVSGAEVAGEQGAEPADENGFDLPPADEGPEIFAGGSSDAFYLCCAAGYCSYRAIDECSLLSSTGKIVALSVAGVSGLVGFTVGFMGGALLLTDHDAWALTPLGGMAFSDNPESILAMGFLGGAVGLLFGGGMGLFAGFLTTPFCDDRSAWKPTRGRDDPFEEIAPPRMSLNEGWRLSE